MLQSYNCSADLPFLTPHGFLFASLHSHWCCHHHHSPLLLSLLLWRFCWAGSFLALVCVTGRGLGRGHLAAGSMCSYAQRSLLTCIGVDGGGLRDFAPLLFLHLGQMPCFPHPSCGSACAQCLYKGSEVMAKKEETGAEQATGRTLSSRGLIAPSQ